MLANSALSCCAACAFAFWKSVGAPRTGAIVANSATVIRVIKVVLAIIMRLSKTEK